MELLLTPWGLGLLGLLVGSFLNVVIHRLPMADLREWWRFDIVEYALGDARAWTPVFGRDTPPPPQLAQAAVAVERALEAVPELTLLRPRSRCPGCAHALRWYENIPVLSWLALRGRCSACKRPISARYPLVELLTAAAFAGCGAVYGSGALSILYCAVLALLIVKTFIDLDATLLPEGLTLSLLGLGAAAALAGWTGVSPRDALAGGLAGYLLLWLPGAFWKHVLHKQAMGEGDMKMLAGLGVLFGWQALPALLLIAAGLGAVLGIVTLLVSRQGRDSKIAFGPYLALAGALCVFLRGDFVAFGAPLAMALGF